MKIVGLTGSIGMGKSTAASLLRGLGVPIFDADAEVHRLQRGGAAAQEIGAAFPGTLRANGSVDRAILGQMVFGNPEKLKLLESLIHPRVAAGRARFAAEHRRRRTKLVVFDIPLLFEGHSEHLCDAIIVVSAPFFLQRQRVLKRPGMTETRFRQILAKQLPDAEKRRRTPYVAPTGLGKLATLRALKKFLREIGSKVANPTPSFPRRRESRGHRLIA